MSCGRTSGTGAFQRWLLLGIGFAAGLSLMLFGPAAGASSAAATPAEKTVGTAEATVGSVQAGPHAAPSLPSTPAAPTPPVTPATPQAPVDAKPPPAPTPSKSGADAPAAKGIAGAGRNPAGSATSAGKETTKRATPSTRNEGGRVSASQSGTDGGASRPTSRATGTAPGAPPAIKAARVVALQRWLAYVWPGIALGGSGADRGLAARTEAAGLVHPSSAAIARLLSPVPPIARLFGASPFVGQPGTGQPGATNAPRAALPDAPRADDGTQIVYLAIFIALSALLAFTLWREFRSVLRPRAR